MSGTLYGLGVGPGDPDLITLKALKILERVPVIAYPAPETGDSLARSIAAPHIPNGRIEIVIRTPTLRRPPDMPVGLLRAGGPTCVWHMHAIRAWHMQVP